LRESLTIEVRNSRDAIAPAAARAEAWLKRYDPGPWAMYLALLSIEELVTNCIRYGYDDAGEHTIAITLGIADHTLTITVIDDGHAFDPLTTADPDFTLTLEDRPLGGLGLYLLRNLADGMRYERHEGLNRLTLTKRLS
jgi:anti-sigma regulatory factor (Ser/Thr protein kinase)